MTTRVTPDDVLDYERQVDKETPPKQDGDEVVKMTPEYRHARLVAEIRLRMRIVVCSLDSLPSHSLAARAKAEHRRELEALLEIVERHSPIIAGDAGLARMYGAVYCPCGDEFPCDDFLSAEKILGPGADRG
jgi:hypothetical protein